MVATVRTHNACINSSPDMMELRKIILPRFQPKADLKNLTNIATKPFKQAVFVPGTLIATSRRAAVASQQ